MVACKKIFEGKLSTRGARKQQNAMEKKITELYNWLNSSAPGKRMNSITKKTLEDLHSDAKNLYVIREEIIVEMSNKNYLKWIEKPELFKNLIHYLSENINAYVNIADRKINANKLLDYANDIIDNKIKNKKEAEKIYLDKLNYDRELFNKLKNTDRNYEWWFDIYDELKDAVFGKFKTNQDILFAEDEKLDFATGDDDGDKRKSVIEAISRLGDKEEPEIRKGLKIMAPSQLITILPILLAQKQAGNTSQKLNNEIRQIIYSLYRSKNLSKTFYNHLINSIYKDE